MKLSNRDKVCYGLGALSIWAATFIAVQVGSQHLREIEIYNKTKLVTGLAGVVAADAKQTYSSWDKAYKLGYEAGAKAQKALDDAAAHPDKKYWEETPITENTTN